MATINRNGKTPSVKSMRQAVKDFITSLDFRSGGIAKVTDTSNPFVSAYYVSMWVKWFGNNTAYQHMVAKRDSYGPTTMNLDLFIDPITNNVNLDTGNGLVDFLTPLPIGRWVNIIYVHDASPVLKERLYMDAIRVASIAITGQGTGSSALLSIGAAESGAIEPFNGLVDEVVIGTYSPTWDDVIDMSKKIIYKNKWGHWKFDEGTGLVFIDSSGNERDGTITTATFSTDVAFKT